MRHGEVGLSHWTLFAALFVASAGLNWLWEMLQMPAYVQTRERSWRETMLLCTAASIGDAVITIAIYGVGVIATSRLRWARKGGWRVYAGAALLGAACAATIELMALATGHWSYSGRMPTVLGVGVWPLLQLTLLVPASLWIAAWLAGRSNEATKGD